MENLNCIILLVDLKSSTIMISNYAFSHNFLFFLDRIFNFTFFPYKGNKKSLKRENDKSRNDDFMQEIFHKRKELKSKMRSAQGEERNKQE